MTQQIQIISAPSILGLKPTGVEELPVSLIKAGLAEKINAVQEIIKVPVLNDGYDSRRDNETNCLNPVAIRDFSLNLMKAVTAQIYGRNFPLVLGGDCSILIGIMPALKWKGNFGLLFLDAHADFYLPDQSTTGELADMDLAIVTGRGPAILTDINYLGPYVKDRNVIHIGQRDAEEAARYGSQDIKASDIVLFDLATIRSDGLKKVTNDIITRMEKLGLDGFWIHFDTDVISDDENPAVDYRLPGGLSFEETSQLLNQLILTGKIIGMSVTIFNPTLDKGSKIAVKLSDCLAVALKGVCSSF
jgi:arginase